METIVWNLAVEAKRKGYEVYILANVPSSFVKDAIKVIGEPKYRVPKAFYGLRFYLTATKNKLRFLNFLDLRRKITVLYQPRLLQQLLKSGKPDLIRIHALPRLATLSAKVVQLTTPIVIWDHGFRHRIKSKMDEAAVQQCVYSTNYLFSISDCSLKNLRKLGLDYKGKAVVGYSGAQDLDRFPLLDREESKWRLNLRKKTVLFVGREARRKGLNILLKAFHVSDW